MTHVDIRVLPMYLIFLAVHVLSGFVGMYGGLVPLFSRKGGRAHRKWGLVFTWALGISSLTSFPIAWWRSDLFQATVGVFSGYLTLYGYRVLRRRPGAGADKIDWALSVVCCIAFAVITLMSSYFIAVAPSPEARVALIFGCLGLIVAGRDLETLITRDNSFQRRVLDHMIASSLALMVAFSAFLNTQFGRLTHLEWSLDKKMLLPLLVAVPLLTYWLPRWSRQLSGAQSMGDLPIGDDGETPELARLRLFGWAEGVTFLLLLGIAVPLKHLGGHPEFVRMMGPIHGAMFMLYIVSVLIAASALRWPRKTTPPLRRQRRPVWDVRAGDEVAACGGRTKIAGREPGGMNMGTPLPIWEAGLLADLAATAIDFTIARLMARLLHVPATFAPFTLLPIASGGLLGAMGATGVYALLTRAVPHPLPVIGIVTALVLLASISLPLRLLKSRPRRTNRFDGATPAVVIVLVGLHTIVALCSLYAIHFWYRGG